MVEWTAQEKKRLRQVLVKRFDDYDRLAEFVSDWLQFSLTALAHEDEGIDLIAFKLIEYVCADDRLDQLHDAFCRSQNHFGIRRTGMVNEMDESLEVPSSRYISIRLMKGLQSRSCNTLLKRAMIETLEAELRTLSGDKYLEIISVAEASFTIYLKLSDAGMRRLQVLMNSGELFQVKGSPVRTIETQLDRAAYHKIELIGAIRRGDLSLADLTEANLVGASLAKAYCIGVNLTGANLTAADLTNAYPVGANFTGANLMGAKCIKADLTGANLTGADLTGADLTQANLAKAFLIGTCFAGANLTGANLTETDLTTADLTDAQLYGVQGLTADDRAELANQGARFTP